MDIMVLYFYKLLVYCFFEGVSRQEELGKNISFTGGTVKAQIKREPFGSSSYLYIAQ